MRAEDKFGLPDIGRRVMSGMLARLSRHSEGLARRPLF